MAINRHYSLHPPPPSLNCEKLFFLVREIREKGFRDTTQTPHAGNELCYWPTRPSSISATAVGNTAVAQGSELEEKGRNCWTFPPEPTSGLNETARVESCRQPKTSLQMTGRITKS